MIRPVIVLLAALVLVGLGTVPPRLRAAEPDPGAIPRTLRPGHPRLYLGDEEFRSLRERVRTDPLLRRWFERLQGDAERMLREPPVRHRLIGPRLLDQSRAAPRRISSLAALYRLHGDRRKADCALGDLRPIAPSPWPT